jgi:bifunctional non-homologous end joining protein LigD
MLATLTEERFSRKGWLFETKFDGERCLALRCGSEVLLWSRNHKRLNDRYPELVTPAGNRRENVSRWTVRSWHSRVT